MVVYWEERVLSEWLDNVMKKDGLGLCRNLRSLLTSLTEYTSWVKQ